MPRGLIRHEHTGNFHLLTFSCYHRFQHLGTAVARDSFEDAMERARRRYKFVVGGYVAMPEHGHRMIGEPVKITVSGVVHALKLSVAMRRAERPFWLARFYGFLVHNEAKRVEKLEYMHRNPVCAAWWRNRKTGDGPVFATTQRASRASWRSSQSGRQRAVEGNCSICGTRRRPVECRALPRCPKARHLGQPWSR